MRDYLATRPDDPSAHFGLGHLLKMLQRVDEARAEFQRSIDLQPVQTESYYQLGQIALDAGEMQTAEPLFRKTLGRDPRHGGALTGLGVIAYRRRDFVAARQQLSAAVESSPEYQPAHYYLGLTLARLGEKANSERELKTAAELCGVKIPMQCRLKQGSSKRRSSTRDAGDRRHTCLHSRRFHRVLSSARRTREGSHSPIAG